MTCSAATTLFQSSRAPRRARCLSLSSLSRPSKSFNPRARRGARVARVVQEGVRLAAKFQSSRAPRRARCPGHGCNAPRAVVSILARAEARALPARHRLRDRSAAVSILARAEARALRTITRWCRRCIGFQSSRAPRRARCGLDRTFAQRADCFNPRARRGARVAFRSVAQRRAHDSFNPRARRGARVAPAAEPATAARRVSILARAEARALPGCKRRVSDIP